jgi:5-methylcytosine-specific restriction endonuclease McrA
MRARSKKMANKYIQRRILVRYMLETYPMCQRCHVKASEEVHEVKSRARGGSILEVENCRAVCHNCHFWITTNPAEALKTGWLKNSWDK